MKRWRENQRLQQSVSPNTYRDDKEEFIITILDKHSSFLHGSTALDAFQFLNPIHSRCDSFDGGSACRKVAIYTRNNTDTEEMHTDINVQCGNRSHDPSVRTGEDDLCFRPHGHCDRSKFSRFRIKE
jgi:hypothetical protein